MIALLLDPTLKELSNTDASVASQQGSIPWWIFATVAGVVVLVGAVLLLLGMRKAGQHEETPCKSCGKILMPDWDECMFCKAPRTFKLGAVEFVSGPLQGRSINLDGEVTTFGSAPGSTVVINDNGVSKKHVGIRKSMIGYELADLGSTNGVFVNGEKVAKKHLQLGDVIRVGTTEMVFKN